MATKLMVGMVAVGAWTVFACGNTVVTVPGTACPGFAGQTVESLASAAGYFIGDNFIPETIPPSVNLTATTGVLDIVAAGTWGRVSVIPRQLLSVFASRTVWCAAATDTHRTWSRRNHAR